MMQVTTNSPELKEGMERIAERHNVRADLHRLERENEELKRLVELYYAQAQDYHADADYWRRKYLDSESENRYMYERGIRRAQSEYGMRLDAMYAKRRQR